MPMPIPKDFDYHQLVLDPLESFTRDAFGLNIENWAKFRHTIAVGTDPDHLKGTSVSDDLKSAYRELGKCHYEVVRSLGFCYLALSQFNFGNFFVQEKSIKDFYFHAGVLLDNLSRLVYIVNVPDAPSATYPSKKNPGKLIRWGIDRTKLLQDWKHCIPAYLPHLDNNLINELTAVRNAHAHYWKIPCQFEPSKGGCWPRDQLRQKAFAWPHHDTKFSDYSDWTPITQIITEHSQALLDTQRNGFELLISDITKFEANNGVKIE